MRDHSLDKIGRLLDSAFGRDKYPPQLVGDLDDLVFSMDTAAEMVRQLLTEPDQHDRRVVERALFGLRVHLQEDLPMVFKDVIAGIDETIGPMEA